MDLEFASAMRSAVIAAAVGLAVVVFGLIGPAALYLIARWRAHRAPAADPQLGLKFALYWFATSAFQLALAGGTRLIYTIIGPHPTAVKGTDYRIAFAMLVPAGLILGVHLMLLRRTNDLEAPGVRRLFLGYNLIVTGLVGFAALVLGFQLLFAKGSVAPRGHLAGAAILVYGAAWAGLGWRFNQLVLGEGGGFGGVPDVVVPPARSPAPPPATSAGGGGGLPPLGGGAYPPIDR